MNGNRTLLIVTLAIVVIGGLIIWRQREAKSKAPVAGWYNLGSESFELKAGGYRGFSYREVPVKFRIEMQSSEPVAFGFVTPDTFGHYTSTVQPVDFANTPCGSAATTKIDLNCATQPDKRYLLLVDSREEAAPEPARKAQKKAPEAPLATNHITVKMYDWRCLEHCENLAPQTPAQ